MLFLVQALHQHIIYINFHIMSNLWTKHIVHQPLISCPPIPQTEGHHRLVKQALTGNEGRLLLIHLIHPYLIVT